MLPVAENGKIEVKYHSRAGLATYGTWHAKHFLMARRSSMFYISILLMIHTEVILTLTCIKIRNTNAQGYATPDADSSS